MRAAAWCLTALLAGMPGVLTAVELTPQEAAGKRIYHEGRSGTGGAIGARVGAADIPMPASALPCASCHGADGQGRPEGGVRPPAITWRRLSVPYGQQTNGRRYPAYDESTLIRALTEGVDSAGNRLDPAMPRFALTPEDMQALVAYLRRLEEDHEPGVGADHLRLGTLLPTSGPYAAAGRTIEAVLRAGLQEINDAGGIHGRQLELMVIDPAAQPSGAALLPISQQVFALLAPLAPGGEPGSAQDMGAIPVVGPLSAGAGAEPGGLTFGIMPSLREQWLALGRHAGTLPEPGAALILYPDAEGFPMLAGLLAEQLAAQGWSQVHRHALLTNEVPAVDSATSAIFFLGSPEQFVTLGESLSHLQPMPRVMAVASQVAGVVFHLPESLSDRVLLSYPFIPADWTEQGVAGLARARRAASLDSEYPVFQVGALSAVHVLAEGLRRAGRDISRARLVSSLESLHDFPTGLTPAVHYGRGQRKAGPVRIVSVNISGKRFQPITGLMGVNDGR